MSRNRGRNVRVPVGSGQEGEGVSRKWVRNVRMAAGSGVEILRG